MTAYLSAWRPWFAMYGVRVRRDSPTPDETEQSLLESILPEEIILHILEKVPPYAVGVVGTLSRHLARLCRSDSLYRTMCLNQWPHALHENTTLVKSNYKGLWRNMFMDRFRLRCEGLYVARNTFLRTGAVEFGSSTRRAGTYLCVYYRYLRFYPDGTVLSRCSPDVVRNVAKTMKRHSPSSSSTSSSSLSSSMREAVQVGRWKLLNDQLYLQFLYESTTTTEIRWRLTLRSTCRGAFNRLDVSQLVTYDREDGTFQPLVASTSAPQWDNGEEEGAEMRRHQRGLSTFVFVNFDHASDLNHPLNLGLDKMDLWLPG